MFRNSGVYSGEFAAKVHSVVLLVAPGGGGEGRTGGERQMKRWPKDVMLQEEIEGGEKLAIIGNQTQAHQICTMRIAFCLLLS